jgi:ATP-dependent protease ClpP protease subunit
MTRKPTRVDAAVLGRVQALLARRDARPLPAGHTRPELRITAAQDGPAELLIYDEISWWGICAVDVAAALATVTGDLHVRINSPGGDMFDGIAIHNLLADHPGQVTVTVDGVAASAASIIAMAGDRIVMNRASQMMIHDASSMCWGNAADLKAMAALLDMASSTLAEVYAGRAGGDAAQWRERMLADAGLGTWYTAEAAVAAGLADEMVSPDRTGDSDDGQGDGDTVTDRLAAALFPYGSADASGRWQLAAVAPQTPDPATQTATQTPDAGTHTPAGSPGGIQPDPVQAPVTETPPTPTGPAHPGPPAGDPVPVPAPPPADPEPAPAPVDQWAELVAPLTTPAAPTADDLLANLREAPL